jgi:hypothetical protein
LVDRWGADNDGWQRENVRNGEAARVDGGDDEHASRKRGCADAVVDPQAWNERTVAPPPHRDDNRIAPLQDA